MKLDFSEETTLADYLEYWLYEFRAKKIRDTTLYDYQLSLFSHIAPKIGNIPLSQLSVNIVQDFFNDEAANGNLRYDGGLSPKSLHNMRGTLSSALEKAVILGYIPRNYAIGVELPVAIYKEMYVLTVEEGRRVRSMALLDEYLDYGLAFWLAITFGLRNGEICGLTWSDIDFNNMTLSVRRTVKRIHNNDPRIQSKSRMYENYPKTEKARRTIPFNKQVRDILLEVKDRRISSDYYGKRNADLAMRKYIFLNKKGNYADTGTVNKSFKRFLKKISIDNENYTMHSLRHTFATRAIEKGADIKTVSELLGHTSVEFTLDRYAHVLNDHARTVMNILLEDQ